MATRTWRAYRCHGVVRSLPKSEAPRDLLRVAELHGPLHGVLRIPDVNRFAGVLVTLSVAHELEDLQLWLTVYQQCATAATTR